MLNDCLKVQPKQFMSKDKDMVSCSMPFIYIDALMVVTSTCIICFFLPIDNS